MRSKTSILALEWMPVSVAGGVRRAVGGFLRYVEFRDQHVEPEQPKGLDAYVRYVAHRDRTSPAGRIFGRDGRLSDGDRHRLVEFVARSTKGLQPMWRRNREGELEDHQRAVYQMILSPEDWRGLDLRRMARVAMKQLETDAGELGLGPWFAAEHRNTKHHHVHIVLAARREIAPGKFRTLLITRRRLQRMKDAIALEINRQRGLEVAVRDERLVAPRPTSTLVRRARGARHTVPHWVWLPRRHARTHPGHRGADRRSSALWTVAALWRFQSAARRYRDRMEGELERDSARAEREGWVR
jgi:hypothetical protein